jgi:hypothetical protein
VIPKRSEVSALPTLGPCSLGATDLAALVGASKLAYVAVETPGGPHVTPVLFASAAQRLWFVVDRR